MRHCRSGQGMRRAMAESKQIVFRLFSASQVAMLHCHFHPFIFGLLSLTTVEAMTILRPFGPIRSWMSDCPRLFLYGVYKPWHLFVASLVDSGWNPPVQWLA